VGLAVPSFGITSPFCPRPLGAGQIEPFLTLGEPCIAAVEGPSAGLRQMIVPVSVVVVHRPDPPALDTRKKCLPGNRAGGVHMRFFSG